MKPRTLPVRRGRVTQRAEYFRVGFEKIATVRYAKASGLLICLTHRAMVCEHIEAVLRYLLRGQIMRVARRPA